MHYFVWHRKVKEKKGTSIPVRITPIGEKRTRKDYKKCKFCGEPLPKYKKEICDNPECQKRGFVERNERHLERVRRGLVGTPII